ncbi:MAG: CCA tRNA nucleotidyltransferase [Pseudomonadota bacterium]
MAVKLEAEWLTSEASVAVTSMLTDGGYQVFFVGGCVRNTLMGRPVADLDLSTNATPEIVMALAETAGLKAIPTGIEHGTVTVVSNHHPYEITTFRRDVETDGRHATVAFSDRIEDDAIRRDFTMNALYAAPDGTLHDPVGGLADLNARRVRFIDDPEQRIQEDYLRILRFFRFHASYGDPKGGIDPDGLAACAAHADGLDQLARERVGPEILKTLGVNDPAPAVASMAASGVLARVLPGADPAPVAPLVHLEGELGRTPHSLSRLAAIFTGDGAECLRLSKKDTTEYERLRDSARSDMGGGELSYRYGEHSAVQCLMIRAALTGQSIDLTELAKTKGAWAYELPVTANDLMPALSGKALGDRLKQLEALWIASDFTLTKNELLALP